MMMTSMMVEYKVLWDHPVMLVDYLVMLVANWMMMASMTVEYSVL